MKKFDKTFFKDFCDLKRLEPQALAELEKSARNGETLAVSLSGGSDSVFLLCLALQIFEKDKLAALHFNHKVRKNADIDEDFAREFCEACGIKLIVGSRKNKLRKISEAELKSARENFVRESAQTLGIKKVLQGHIKSDVAETMLMRLMRGASLDGLCAPRPISKKNGLVFIRPLLTLNKGDTQQILREKKIDWREDESNFQNEFLRNKLRNIVIPEILKIENVDFFKACLRSRSLLEEDANFIENILEGAILKESEKSLSLKGQEFCQRAILRRAAQRLLSKNGLSARASAIDKFLNECEGGKDAIVNIGNSALCFLKASNKLYIENLEAEKISPQNLKLGENTLSDGSKIILEKLKISDVEYEKIKAGAYPESQFAHIIEVEQLCAKPYEAGDAYAPIGAKTPRLVKDMMSAKKTPALKRFRLPLVCSRGEIVWAPTLAPAESFKIRKNCDAIRLTYLERS